MFFLHYVCSVKIEKLYRFDNLPMPSSKLLCSVYTKKSYSIQFVGYFFYFCFCIESSKSRHQQQTTERSKERRPSKPVRKVHKVTPVSEQNSKPGRVVFTICWPTQYWICFGVVVFLVQRMKVKNQQSFRFMLLFFHLLLGTLWSTFVAWRLNGFFS